MAVMFVKSVGMLRPSCSFRVGGALLGKVVGAGGARAVYCGVVSCRLGIPPPRLLVRQVTTLRVGAIE